MDDVTLLRRVLAWARSEGWRMEFASSVGGRTMTHSWSHPSSPPPNVELEQHEAGWDIRAWVWRPRIRAVRVTCTTVREAVDVLVAVGILPAEFSPARAPGGER